LVEVSKMELGESSNRGGVFPQKRDTISQSYLKGIRNAGFTVNSKRREKEMGRQENASCDEEKRWGIKSAKMDGKERRGKGERNQWRAINQKSLIN